MEETYDKRLYEEINIYGLFFLVAKKNPHLQGLDKNI